MEPAAARTFKPSPVIDSTHERRIVLAMSDTEITPAPTPAAEQDRRRLARRAHARAVPRPPPEGHGARLHRRPLGRASPGHLPLRRLRRRAVPVGDQVRLGDGLAELLRACELGGRRDRNRQVVVHDPDRGQLRGLWRPPRPRLRRRSEPDRPALLHQLGLAGARSRDLISRVRDRPGCGSMSLEDPAVDGR